MKKESKTWCELEPKEKFLRVFYGFLVVVCIMGISQCSDRMDAEKIAEESGPLLRKNAIRYCFHKFAMTAKYGYKTDYSKTTTREYADYFSVHARGHLENAYGVDVAKTLTCIVSKETKSVTSYQYTHGH